MENLNTNELQYKPVIMEVFKEFRATGNFDRLRKEYFSEIIAQVTKSLS